MKNHYSSFLIGAALLTSSASAEWQYGVGTGLYQLNIDGDIGFTTMGGTPVESSVELDPEDISDLMTSAFGLEGYASNGKWMLTGGFSYLELEGDGSRGPVAMSLDFETVTASAMVGYLFYMDHGLSVRGHGGLRYTSHHFDSDITLTPGPTSSRSIDEDWVDAIIGLTAVWQFAEEWFWRNQAVAGFGGSEGMFFAQTGIDWRFHKNWSTSLFANTRAVDYESGDVGDSDYYSYDADEFGWGLNVMFHW